jgi:Glycosyltransferase family 87
MGTGVALAGRRVGRVLCFVVLPAALAALFAFGAARATYAWDFHAFWQAAADVAHARDPYAAPGLNADGRDYPLYLYPPLLADLVLPLGLLPFLTAAVVFIAGSALAVVAALRLLDVRDVRCYGVAFLWFPVVHGLRLGTLTPLLVLGIAVCWRLRGTPRQRLPLALVTIVKLFLWPLIVWQWARSGLRTTCRTLVVALLVAAASWATIGFAHLVDYPKILRGPQSVWLANGYGLGALGHALHVRDTTTSALLLVAGAVASTSVFRALRARRIDERESLALFVVIACVCSPAAWLHYWALLLVPLALLSPTLSLAWFVPLLLWVTPFEESSGEPWRIALGLAVASATLGYALLRYRVGSLRPRLVRTLAGATALRSG